MNEAVLKEKIKLLETALINSEHVSCSFRFWPGMTRGQAVTQHSKAMREALRKSAWSTIERIRGMGE